MSQIQRFDLEQHHCLRIYIQSCARGKCCLCCSSSLRYYDTADGHHCGRHRCHNKDCRTQERDRCCIGTRGPSFLTQAIRTKSSAPRICRESLLRHQDLAHFTALVQQQLARGASLTRRYTVHHIVFTITTRHMLLRRNVARQSTYSLSTNRFSFIV